MEELREKSDSESFDDEKEKVLNVKKDTVRIEFTKPVCANIGDKIAMSRRVENNFRLIGWGEIKKCYSQNSKKKTSWNFLSFIM